VIDVAPYLRRIGYDGPVHPRVEVLRALHLAHLCTVPFENLDIHLGRPIVLCEEAQLRKVVRERRGGFCYELNGAFATLLLALGFRVSLLSAGAMGADGRFGPPFDHLLLEVHCPDGSDGSAGWLADVGFGEGFLEPLRFEVGEEQPQGNGVYRLDRDGDDYVLLRRTEPDGPLDPQYRFTAQPRELTDFAEMCRYHQTSPESHFTRQRVCSLATPEGRVTLTEGRLIVTRRGERTELPIQDDAAYRAALRERFGIELVGDWVR
jgi:N-hydroxyarylamine O-acetyltransferase